MSATLGLTEYSTLSALRTFLIGILPAGIEVIRAEINRVPEPAGVNFVVMTPILRERLSTNVTAYLDNAAFTPLATDSGLTITTDAGAPLYVTPQPAGFRTVLQATRVTVQIDVHGPASADNAQIISTLLRDGYGCDAFTATGFDVQPLYASEPRQTPFLNGEQQIEFRWVVDAVLQANPIVTVPQQFAGAVVVGIIEVDAVYPP